MPEGSICKTHTCSIGHIPAFLSMETRDRGTSALGHLKQWNHHQKAQKCEMKIHVLNRKENENKLPSHILCVMHYTRNFSYIISLLPHKNTMMLIFVFFRWESWGSELCNLPSQASRKQQSKTKGLLRWLHKKKFYSCFLIVVGREISSILSADSHTHMEVPMGELWE